VFLASASPSRLCPWPALVQQKFRPELRRKTASDTDLSCVVKRLRTTRRSPSRLRFGAVLSTDTHCRNVARPAPSPPDLVPTFPVFFSLASPASRADPLRLLPPLRLFPTPTSTADGTGARNHTTLHCNLINLGEDGTGHANPSVQLLSARTLACPVPILPWSVR